MRTTTWPFFRFALLVTGKGEEQFLPSLFRSLEAGRHCTFKITARVPQLRPITSTFRKLKTVGTAKRIPSRDEEIGLIARRCLERLEYVILVDDLEHAYSDQAKDVFQRYREAIDTMLRPLGLESRASVHFLVNMLEAYFFADASAVNSVLGTNIADHEGDVETIRHPKNELKGLHRGYREIEHGSLILRSLDVPRVLANAATCRSLRTLFGWCSKAIGQDFTDLYQLRNGSYFDVTRLQIDALPDAASGAPDVPPDTGGAGAG